MAATNFTPIILYHSVTASAAPTAGNLNNGELAINITDGKLFYKDNGGVVQIIATKGTGVIGGSNNQVQYNSSGALAGSANFTFDGTTATINTLNLTTVLDETYGGTGLTSYTTGDVIYASGSNTLAKLAIGANTYILTSTGSVPQWSAPSAVSVSTATNLAGGTAGAVPYQSGVGATTFLSIGTNNQVLTSTGSAPQWVSGLSLTTLSTSGNTTLGDAAADNLTINATVTSNLIFTDNTYDIGANGATRPRTIYAGTSIFSPLVDTTNLEVTNIKALDGTAAASIANSTGVISISANPVLSGGTANGVLYLNASKSATSGTALVFDGTGALSLANTGNVIATIQSTSTGGTRSATLRLNVASTGGDDPAGTIAFTYDAGFTQAAAIEVTHTSPLMKFVLGSTERVRINSTGNFETRPAANGHAVFNEDGVDADFRVESDTNTHMLFVDAGNNRVGINSSSPASVFTINQPGDGDGITITHTSRPGIWKWYHSGVDSENFAFIQNNGSSDAVAYLMGRSDHYWNTNNVERLRISTSEIVANDSGANFDFRVESDNNTYMLWVDASADGVNIGGFDTIQGQLNVIKNTGDLVASTTALYITTGQTYGSAANKKNLDLVFQGYRDGAGTGGGAKARLRAIEQTADSRVGSLLIDVMDSAGDLQNALELTSSNVVVNQGGIDMDFRVESDTNTHALFVDAGNSRVGVNASAPVTTFQVFSTGSNYEPSSGTGYGDFYVGNGSYGLAIGPATGGGGAGDTRIWLKGGTENLIFTNATNSNSVLQLYPTAVVVNESGADQDFRVESDTDTHCLFVDAGNSRVGVATSSPLATFQVGDPLTATAGIRVSGTHLNVDAGYQSVGVNGTAAAPSLILGGDDNTGIWHPASDTLAISTAGLERARIESAGNFLFGSNTNRSGTPIYAESTTTAYAQSWWNYHGSAPLGLNMFYAGAAPNGTGNSFVVCNDTAALRAEIRSNGGLANYSANNVNLASDRRLKNTIEPMRSYYDVFKNINWVTWLYNDQTDDLKNHGVIAQELQELAPEFVCESNAKEAPEGEAPYLGIWEQDFKMAGMSVITELIKKIEKLEAEVAALKGV